MRVRLLFAALGFAAGYALAANVAQQCIADSIAMERSYVSRLATCHELADGVEAFMWELRH